MTHLDQKINDHFAGLVVRKDLVKLVKGNAIGPSYVLKYLLGQYCATSDEASIQSGVTTAQEILRKHYVHRNEAGLIRSVIRDRTAVQKTFSGLMKILFPHKEATPAEVEELLRFAVEGCKRIKDQLLRIDPTYPPVTFAYGNGRGQVRPLEVSD
jgi:predicted ATP-dependent Lon-type protease